MTKLTKSVAISFANEDTILLGIALKDVPITWRPGESSIPTILVVPTLARHIFFGNCISIVKPWNSVFQDVNPDTFSSPISFKNLLERRYLELLHSVYDVELSCTWSLVRDCPCHRE